MMKIHTIETPFPPNMSSYPVFASWLPLKTFINLFLLSLFLRPSSSSSSFPHPFLSHHHVNETTEKLQNHTTISGFRVVNRRALFQCPDLNPYLRIDFSPNSNLSDDQQVRVNVSGVLVPSKGDWVAMISPSASHASGCPFNDFMYAQTGDLSHLPLLCHYPVKAQHLSSDPDYMDCKKKECKKHIKGRCLVSTCTASLSFHVINIRTDIEFVLFTGGFEAPCILKRSNPASFSSPSRPLHGHLSSIDSSATSMRLTWVSGDRNPQQVRYGNKKSTTSQVATFTSDDMCSSKLLSPAKDFGWHEPGFIHSAVMTGLQPLANFSYTYGSDSVGWSDPVQFRTPPAGGSDKLTFLIFGDMGKAPRDASVEHYIQPGSISVVEAMAAEVAKGSVDSIFHIGDISYATGFLVEWDYFLHLITPVASKLSYMTAIGNHERDYADSGSVYVTPDSGGECGVPYETYFPMPTVEKDKPWYSIEQGSVHFTVISTEHDWRENSQQYKWMLKDMGSVNRSRTPWLIFTGHRPMYTSARDLFSTDLRFVQTVEPLLLQNKVDLALFGHVHNYERTCAVYAKQCKAMPTKDASGTDTYDNSNYGAPVHAIVGMGGFKLDEFPELIGQWSLARISKYGYARVHATREELKFEFVNSNSSRVEDSFRITKQQS